MQRFIATYSRPSLTWNDLAFLRGLTRLPILLAGEAGVREVSADLVADFDVALGLAGCTAVAEVRRDALIHAGEVPTGSGG